MASLTALHLSDAHWSSAKSFEQRIIIDRMIDDLNGLKERGISPDIIIFSGDLVQAGEDKTAFKAAYNAILKPLLDSTGLTIERLFVCPGNHDISRSTARSQKLLESGLHASLISEEAVNQFVRAAEARSSMEHSALHRMENFYAWHDVTLPGFTKASKFARLKTISISGKKVAVCLLNTAWRATGEEGDVDNGRLILGSIFIDSAIQRIEDCDYKIAVFHHPFEYHAEFDRSVTEPRIARAFDLICTGHTHRPRPERIQDIYGSSVRSQAGSLYAGSRWFNGYQIIQVDFVEDTTRVFCREYYGVRGEFAAASNLTSADPMILDFAVKTRDSDDQIALFLDHNREKVKVDLLNHLDFTNSGDLSDDNLLRAFACPKLFKTGKIKLDESGNVADSYVKAGLDDILSADENVLFFGQRQTGKTSLKHYIAYRYSHNLAVDPRIPIYIDVENFAYNLYGIKRAIATQYDVPAKFDLDVAVKKGQFVFLFEDVGTLDESGLKQLSAFIKAFHPSRSFVFGCPDESSVAKERHFRKYLPELSLVGLGELTRGAIRRMANCWFDDANEAKASFELVVSQINRDGLPRTAYIVSLLLWAAKQGQRGERLNEAVLLQNVLDHLLNRSDFTSARRGSLTPKGKELLLSKLANCLQEVGHSARSLELIGWVDAYFQQKRLSYDADEVVSELTQCGILKREDGRISFRYRCFQEYFIALGMMDQSELIAKAEGRKFLRIPREVELLSGLKGDNEWLISNIQKVLDEAMPRDLADVT